MYLLQFLFAYAKGLRVTKLAASEIDNVMEYKVKYIIWSLCFFHKFKSITTPINRHLINFSGDLLRVLNK
jgi:hypothetical protein